MAIGYDRDGKINFLKKFAHTEGDFNRPVNDIADHSIEAMKRVIWNETRYSEKKIREAGEQEIKTDCSRMFTENHFIENTKLAQYKIEGAITAIPRYLENLCDDARIKVNKLPIVGKVLGIIPGAVQMVAAITRALLDTDYSAQFNRSHGARNFSIFSHLSLSKIISLPLSFVGGAIISAYKASGGEAFKDAREKFQNMRKEKMGDCIVRIDVTVPSLDSNQLAHASERDKNYSEKTDTAKLGGQRMRQINQTNPEVSNKEEGQGGCHM